MAGGSLRRKLRYARQVPARDWTTPKALAALRSEPFTKLSYAKLARLWELTRTAPPGAVVECGVWRGGSAAMIARADPKRELWLFDSWQGLPPPGLLDVATGGKRVAAGENPASEADVQKAFRRVPAQANLVAGWFEDTLSARKGEIGPIGLLHLDGDWYDSILVCLRELHDQVVPGGIIAVDDYGHWEGCRAAVDEFLVGREVVRLGVVDDALAWRIPALEPRASCAKSS